MDANTIYTGFPLADYKLFLPLGKGVHVLVVGTQEYAFLPYLVRDVERIDIFIDGANETYWRRILTTLALVKVKLIKTIDQHYDLVFSDGVEVRHLREGGTLCRFFKSRDSLLEPTPLRRLGAWFAWPDWPDFRVLIPDSVYGTRAATHHLPLYSHRPLGDFMARWAPQAVAPRLGEQGIIIYRRDGHPRYPSYWERCVVALSSSREEMAFLPHVTADRWLLWSGSVARTSPITAMVVDDLGYPQVTIKCARSPEQLQLQEEKQLEALVTHIEGDLLEKLSLPIAAVKVDGRPVLAYQLAADSTMGAGLRWRFHGLPRFVRALTGWLMEVGYRTAHPLPVAVFWEKHGLPLEHLLEQNMLPPHLKNAAEQALFVLDQYRFRAFSVFEHGDLGIHNVQIKGKEGQDFRILNCEFAELDGAPLVDLCYLLVSLKVSPGLAARYMGAYLTRMGYPSAMALPLWLSYLARRWQPGDDPSVAPQRLNAQGKRLLQMTAQIETYVSLLEKDASLG